MAALLKIVDESTSGKIKQEFTLTLASEQTTVQEIIEQRVRLEVEKFNQQEAEALFSGLVQPKNTEKKLNGYHMKKWRPIDVDDQIETALEAFKSNGFFMLADDRQLESLDEKIGVTPDMTISFLKLVPLVGG